LAIEQSCLQYGRRVGARAVPVDLRRHARAAPASLGRGLATVVSRVVPQPIRVFKIGAE
jgi:hypothetical protein